MAGIATKSDRSYQERQATTRAPGGDGTAPALITGTGIDNPPDPGEGMPIATTNQGDGLALANLNAIVVTLVANLGRTITSGGTLYAWLWDYSLVLWKRAQYLDQPITWNGVAAQRVMVLAPLQNISRLGTRLHFCTKGLSYSGGSADALIRMDGYIGHFGS